MCELVLEFTNENIKEVVDDKYNLYNNKVKISENTVDEKKLKIKHYPEVDGYCGTFFHIITKDFFNKEISCCPNNLIKCQKDFKYNPLMGCDYSDNKKRTICPHKMNTMHILINFFKEDGLLVWERSESTPKGRRIRIKIFSLRHKYLVILEKRKNGDVYYWTSYPVDHKYKVEKFKKEYSKYKDTTPKYIFSKH